MFTLAHFMGPGSCLLHLLSGPPLRKGSAGDCQRYAVMPRVGAVWEFQQRNAGTGLVC